MAPNGGTIPTNFAIVSLLSISLAFALLSSWALTERPSAPTRSPSGSNIAIGTLANSPTWLSHAPTAAALASWVDTSVPVMRDDVSVIYADTGATCVNPDGGAQIQPTISGKNVCRSLLVSKFDPGGTLASLELQR